MAMYLVTIHGVEQVWDAMSPDVERLRAAGHEAFRRAAGERLLGGHEVDRSPPLERLLVWPRCLTPGPAIRQRRGGAGVSAPSRHVGRRGGRGCRTRRR